MKKLIICLALIFFMIPCAVPAGAQETTGAPAGEAVIAKAKAEGKVTFYANITAIEPVIEDFTKKYGIKVEYTRISTSKFVATVLTEHEAGKLVADVLQAPMPILEMLKAKGVLASYKSPSASGYPEWAVKDDKIQLFGIEYVALIYNKELVNITLDYLELVNSMQSAGK